LSRFSGETGMCCSLIPVYGLAEGATIAISRLEPREPEVVRAEP
jgi:hypothetical protein